MNKQVLLNAKNCKQSGYFIRQIVTYDVDEEKYYDYATPFKFGYLTEGLTEQYKVSMIRTIGTSIMIHTYRELDYKVDDLISINNVWYAIKSINVTYETYGKIVVKHYFIELS